MNAAARTAARHPAYLVVLQFVFVSTWTVYAVFLPGLLAAAGIGKQWAGWVLLADQAAFAVFDIVFGAAAGHGLRRYAAVAPAVVAATLLSCAAFLALPWIAGQGALLLALTAVWVVTSSALRAPLFALLARHAAAPQRAWLAAAMTLGMACAGGFAPWLGQQLKTVDPALPFALSSIALALLVLPLARAERSRPAETTPGGSVLPAPAIGRAGFLLALVAAAFAVQVFFNLGAAPRYLKDNPAEALAWLMPVFWIGVAAGTFACERWQQRVSTPMIFGTGAMLAAIGAALSPLLPGSTAAILAQAVGGIGWGLSLTAGFAIAADHGRRVDNEGLMIGLLFSMIAVATFARIAVNLAGLPADPAWASLFAATPVLMWGLSSAIVLPAARHSGRGAR